MNHNISPPLPLPIGLRLLPSLLPGKQLTPCLYIEVNDLPIYLIISPSLEPQLSFLSLILALQPNEFASPLAFLNRYTYNHSDLDFTLNGLAPWADFWLPLRAARSIIRSIGNDRFFWDEEGKGLLGDVDHAGSWEEDGGWSHNWIPFNIPKSSYSLDILLSVKWTRMGVIPDQRYVHTPAGSERIARLQSDGLFGNPSAIRSAPWNVIWEALLDWTKRSWTEFLANPSRVSDKRIRSGNDPIAKLLQTIPKLLNSDKTPGPPITSSDMTDIFSVNEVSTYDLLYELILILWDIFLRLVPGFKFLSQRVLRTGSRSSESLKLRIRLNLALCALSWDLVIYIWRSKRENMMLNKQLDDGGIDPSAKTRSVSGVNTKIEEKDDIKTPRRKRDTGSDDFEKLERRRGGSPPPNNDKHQSSSPTSESSASLKRSRHRPSRFRSRSKSQTPRSSRLTTSVSASRRFRDRQISKDRYASSPSKSERDWADGHDLDRFLPSRPIRPPVQTPNRGSSVDDIDQAPPFPSHTKDEELDHSRSSSKPANVNHLGPQNEGCTCANAASDDVSDLDDASGSDDDGYMYQEEGKVDEHQVRTWVSKGIMYPFLVYVIATILLVWWKQDPPEPAVVVT